MRQRFSNLIKTLLTWCRRLPVGKKDPVLEELADR